MFDWNFVNNGASLLSYIYVLRDFLKYLNEKSNNIINLSNLLRDHRKLIKQINESNFNYNAVIIVNIHGFFIPNFIYNDLKHKLILHVYCYESGSDGKHFRLYSETMDRIETEKWILFVPKITIYMKNLNILVLDDFAISGKSLALIKGHFKSCKSIKTATLYITDVVDHGKIKPDYYISEKSLRIKTPYDKIR